MTTGMQVEILDVPTKHRDGNIYPVHQIATGKRGWMGQLQAVGTSPILDSALDAMLWVEGQMENVKATYEKCRETTRWIK